MAAEIQFRQMHDQLVMHNERNDLNYLNTLMSSELVVTPQEKKVYSSLWTAQCAEAMEK